MIYVLCYPTSRTVHSVFRCGHAPSKEQLSQLVVEEDAGAEAQRRHCEVSWREAPGTQGSVEQRDVEPGGHLAERKQYSESESVVGHLLLVERDGSCFGSNQTNSLHCEDRDQVGRLGVLQGLSRIANWVPGHTRDSLERWDGFVIRSPSARGPGVLIPGGCIEQSDIDLSMFDRVPA